MKSPPQLYLFLRQVLYGSVVGIATGCASALFLHLLDFSTRTRNHYPALLFLLPLAGIICLELYRRYGKGTEAGNNLILERIHEAEGDPIPFRMAPLVLICTLLTHVCGGSAGREGTAVQMGGAISEGWGKLLRVTVSERKWLLMAGVSGGFGAVFGTPLAGAIFGMEVLEVGRLKVEAVVPCLMASIVGDRICRELGVIHHAYPIISMPSLSANLLTGLVIFGLLCGLIVKVFIVLTHFIRDTLQKKVSPSWLHPVGGGLVVIGLVYTLHTRDYLGLSLGLIEKSFTPGGVLPLAFALKLLFTSVTLGTGFRGGEVTPLFCIGATMGYTFAHLAHLPTPLFAALGFVAVFAGAAKTPLACFLLGMELFGVSAGVLFLTVCVLSKIASGKTGIYHAQRRRKAS